MWREIEFLQNIEHDNIIQYFDHWQVAHPEAHTVWLVCTHDSAASQDGKFIWLAMEFANCGDLDDKFKAIGVTGRVDAGSHSTVGDRTVLH